MSAAVMDRAGSATVPTATAVPVLGVLLGLLLATVMVSVGLGAVAISPLQILSIASERLGLGALTEHSLIQASVLLDVRLPRVVLAVLVGAAMAGAGTVMQALFRNPLAEPTIVGVSSGAALGAVGWVVLAGSLAPLAAVSAALGHFALPAAAFVGALLASFVVYGLARAAIADGQTFMLLLAGIAFTAIANAGVGLLTYVADDQQLRTITFWTMGSLGGAGWAEIRALLVFLLPGLLALAALTRLLDALLLGEAVAGHLGFDMARARPALVACVAVLVGASVAMTGLIGFIGLMAPHIARMLVGAGHRRLVPGSLLVGALLLLLADIASRLVAAPAEVPVGLITALIGGPFFLLLLYRRLGAR